jgi:biotin transport system permease protein
VRSLGLYVPGDSFLHRAPAGAKLLVLLVFGVATVFLNQWPGVTVALVVVLGLYAWARIGWRMLFAQIRPLWALLLFVAVFHTWVSGPVRAYEVLGALIALVLAAALVTLTSPVSAMVDAVVAAARPLRRLGADPERIGLMLTLGIRCVPLMAVLVREVSEAQWARGAQRSVRAFAVPLIVRALRQADALGESLVARGVDD